MYAAMENRTLLIDRMIELGCDIHAKNKEQYTTLHLASMYSREDTVKQLLSKKADPTGSGGVMTQNDMNKYAQKNGRKCRKMAKKCRKVLGKIVKNV